MQCSLAIHMILMFIHHSLHSGVIRPWWEECSRHHHTTQASLPIILGSLWAQPLHTLAMFLLLTRRSAQQLGPKQSDDHQREVGVSHFNQCKSPEGQGAVGLHHYVTMNFRNIKLQVSTTAPGASMIRTREKSVLSSIWWHKTRKEKRALGVDG